MNEEASLDADEVEVGGVWNVAAVETAHEEESIDIGSMITVDSGAAESVMPWQFVSSSMDELREVKDGKKFIAANGERIANYGRHNMSFRTDGGTLKKISFYATSVWKPLAAVSKSVQQNNKVGFRPSGSYIRSLSTGERIPLRETRGTYAFDAKSFSKDSLPQTSVFPRPA